MKRLVTLAFVALLCLRCNHQDGSVGPCIHIYEEPVLNVLSVTDRVTNIRIGAVWVTEVLLDTTELDLLALRQGVSTNVSYSDSGLYCIPPFGFGTQRGLYTLSLSADGYRDTVVSLPAAYAVFRGGCPSSNTGGTRVVVKMSPL